MAVITKHNPNLPRESMPWAKDIERALQEVERNQIAMRTGSLANNQQIATGNVVMQNHAVTMAEHEVIMAENDAKIALAQQELDDLNAPDGPLAEMESTLDAINGPGGTLEVMQGELDDADFQINDPAGRVQTAINTANTADGTANGALTAANGKNKLYFQTAQPGLTGNVVGDTWFDTDDGNKIYRWNGSAWTATTLGATALDSAVNATLTSANGKNKVYYQAAQPGTTGNVVGDTWFDTDDDNKIYQWNGTAWTALAGFGLGALSSSVQTTITSSTGKNRVIVNSGAASGTAYSNGDVWYQVDGSSNVIGFWVFNGTAWISRPMTNSVIASLDAGKITSGFIDAARINAQTITAAMMVSNTITATSGVIQDGAITNAKIANLDAAKITTGFLAAARIQADTITATMMAPNTITATSGIIANAAITNAMVANLDAAKITTGFLDANRIDVNTIRAEQLLVSPGNIFPDPYIKRPASWTGTGIAVVADSRFPNGSALQITSATAQRGTYYGGSANYASQIEPGAEYKIRALVDINAVNTNRIAFYIRGLNSAGSVVSTSVNLTTQNAPVALSYWEAVITAPATLASGAAFGFYTVTPYTAGSVFEVGDVTLVRRVGSTLIENGAVTTDKVLANNIVTSHMAAGSINGDRITANTLNANKIIARSITADRIELNAITSNEITTNDLTALSIVSSTIASTSINAGTITGTTITGGTINGTVINSVRYTGSDFLIEQTGFAYKLRFNGQGIKFYDTSGPNGAYIGTISGQRSGGANSGNGEVFIGAEDAAGVTHGAGFGDIGTTIEGANGVVDINATDVSFQNTYTNVLRLNQINTGAGVTSSGRFSVNAAPAVNQTIATPNTYTRVTLNNQTHVSSSRITIPAGMSGVFRITADLVAVPTNANTWRDIQIRVNGTAVNGTTRGAAMGPNGNSTINSLSVPIALVAGDYVELWTQGSSAAGSTTVQWATTGLSVSREQF